MGAVYEGRHEATGERAAIKTAIVAEPFMLTSIRREVRVLARIHHPNIVRVLEQGVQDGRPWYAMELLEGKNLRDGVLTTRGRQASEASTRLVSPCAPTEKLAERSEVDTTPVPDTTQGLGPVGPEELRSILEVALRLCDPLGHLHSQGLAHRDLKPENIFLQEGNQPVLVDFGMVSWRENSGREDLEAVTTVGGTVAYMAPEQIKGGAIDARCDLYSLGCILFELVTGRLPFVGTTGEVIAQHLQAEPPSAGDLAPAATPELERLIAGLLAKDPADRIGYTDEVASVIARILGIDPPPVHPAYLYRPRMVARAHATEFLSAAVARARQSASQAVLVLGESGIGKTRLAGELVIDVSRTSMTAIVGTSHQPDESGSPISSFLPLLQHLADRLQAADAATRGRLSGRALQVLAPYSEALAPFAPPEPPLPELPPEARRLRVISSLAAAVTSLAAEGPLMLVLDDLQWGSDVELQSFLRLARRPEPVPLLLVGLCRSDEVPASLRHALAESRVLLGRLDEAAVAALASDMLALRPLPGRFARFLHEQSEGNPFFAAEYVRTAVASGVLVREIGVGWRVRGSSDEHPWESLPLPETLHELAQRRMGSLSPAARCLLDAASILGSPLAPRILEVLSGLVEDDYLMGINELILRAVLQEHPPGMLSFCHRTLRTVVLERIPPDRRRSLHLAAAEALLEHDASPSQEVLGEHWRQGGDRGRAIASFLEGMRRAHEKSDYHTEVRLGNKALELLGEDDPRWLETALQISGNALQAQGRYDEAMALLARVLPRARAQGDKKHLALTLMLMGNADRSPGYLVESRKLHEQALGLYREIGDRHGELAVMVNLATTIMYLDGWAAGEDAFQKALRLAREQGNSYHEGLLLLNFAIAQSQRGEHLASDATFEAAERIAERLGRKRLLGFITMNRVTPLTNSPRWREAQAGMERAIELGREMGDELLENAASMNLANIHQTRGESDRARALYEKCRDRFLDIDRADWAAQSSTNLGLLCMEEGDPDAAVEHLTQSLQVHRRFSDVPFATTAQIHLADLYGDRGEPEAARRVLAEVRTEDPRLLGQVHRARARLERVTHSSDARRLAEESVRALDQDHNWTELGRALLELSQSQPSNERQATLTRVHDIVEQLELGPRAPLVRELRHVERELASRGESP